MEFTMRYGRLFVKGRKSAAFPAHMHAALRKVNHY
jgi:hypothetical protein